MGIEGEVLSESDGYGRALTWLPRVLRGCTTRVVTCGGRRGWLRSELRG
jgi:hypothetical protein